MNDDLLISELLAVAAAHTAFAGWALRGQHDDETLKSTVLVLTSKTTPLCGSPSVGTATLTAIVRSQAQDFTPAQHGDRVKAVLAWLVNSGTRIAVNARNKVLLMGKPAMQPNDPGLSQDSFETVLTALIGWRVV